MHGCVAVAFFGVSLSVPVRDVSSFGSCVCFSSLGFLSVVQRGCQEFCKSFARAKRFPKSFAQQFARILQELPRVYRERFAKSFARVLHWQEFYREICQEFYRQVCQDFAKTLQEFCKSSARVSRQFRSSFARVSQRVSPELCNTLARGL